MSESEIYFNNLLLYSGYIPTFAWLLPITIALISWRKLSSAHKNFFYFGLFMFIFNVLVLTFLWSTNKHYSFWKPYLEHWNIENPMFTRILFHIETFIFLGLCYFELIKNSVLNRYKYPLIYLLCIVSSLIYFFIDDYRGYGTVGQNFYSIFILVICVMYMRLLFSSKLNRQLLQISFFWITIGLLIPKTITLIYEFTAQNLYNDNFILYCKANIATNIIEFLGILTIGFGFYKLR